MPWTGKPVDEAPPQPMPQALYRVPRWLRWLETQDDHDGLLPAGLYEPTILDVYWQWGWRWAAIRWLWRDGHGVLVRFAFNLVLVTPPWFFGRALWLPIGWHLHEFFDAFWTPGVQWPGPDDATGRVALGLPRLENYRTAAPQGAE